MTATRRGMLAGLGALAVPAASHALTPGQRAILFGGGGLQRFFGGSPGFWFDWTGGATGTGISLVNSLPPGTDSAVQASGTAQPASTAGTPASFAQFDGINDNLLSTLNPSASVTMGFCGRITTGAATQIIMGSQLASSGRVRISLSATNQFAGAVGGQTESTITSGIGVGSTDFVGLLVVNATTVELWVNGVRRYSAAISGAPNTTVPIALGAGNAAGAMGSFAGGRFYRIATINREMPFSLKVPMQRALAKGIVNF